MSAQKTAPVAVDGKVVKLDRNAGSFVGSDGNAVAYDYFEARVLTDSFDVVYVRLDPAGAVPLPQHGDRVHYLCEARSAGGNVKLTANAVQHLTYDDLLALSVASA